MYIGLNADEIDVAVARVQQHQQLTTTTTTTAAANQQQQQHSMDVISMQQQQQSKWRDYANVLVMFGGLSYACYYQCRVSYLPNKSSLVALCTINKCLKLLITLQKLILPKLFGVADPDVQAAVKVQEQLEELHNSFRFMMDSVQQTLQAVQHNNNNNTRVAAANVCFVCCLNQMFNI